MRYENSKHYLIRQLLLQRVRLCKQSVTVFLFLLSIFALTSCGTYEAYKDQPQQEDYTSVNFSLSFEDKPTLSSSKSTSGQRGDRVGTSKTLYKVDCDTSLIATIDVIVYDSANSEIIDASYSCNAHSGSIQVPSGNNNTFLFSAKDSNGLERYRGMRYGVNLSPGTRYDLGEITMDYTGNTGERWVLTGLMKQSRMWESATLLPDGKILVSGGAAELRPSEGKADIVHNAAELYDPVLSTFSSTGNMNLKRAWHFPERPGIVLLNNGLVLLTGGYDGANTAYTYSSAELYNPSSGTFSYTGVMPFNSMHHSAILLQDGRVFIGPATPNMAAIYDPYSGTFSSTANPPVYSRIFHTATLLPDGKVLITGGWAGNSPASAISGAELFDPNTGTFSETGNMNYVRHGHRATLLPDGRVLITGGNRWSDVLGREEALNSAEIYDPLTGKFSVIGSMNYPRHTHTATLLLNGLVLITGGDGGGGENCELYDPSTGQFTLTAKMPVAKNWHLVTLLPDGSVLFTGGNQRTVERYIPYPASDSTSPYNPDVTINNGASTTGSRDITLSLSASDDSGVSGYYVSELPTLPLSTLSAWIPIALTPGYSANVPYILSSGDGIKTIFVWYKDVAGNVSEMTKSSITLSMGTILSAPSGVTTAAGDSQATISWNAVSGATSYNIYWLTTSGVSKTTGTKISGITSTSYIHTGLTNSTAYYHVVTAVNNNGESGESNQVSAVPQSVFTSGLIAYYPFNSDANDASGNGYHGTVNGATLTADRFGNANSAYSFDGVNDYIDLSNTSTLNFTSGGFTLSAWVKFSNTNTDTMIIGKHIPYYSNGYFLGVGWTNKSSNTFNFFVDSDLRLVTTETYNDGNWHFVAGTYDGTTQYLYVDGVLKASQQRSYSTTNNIDITIGGLVGLDYFNGLIDDVRIYNFPLSISEIQTLYNSGTNLDNTAPSNTTESNFINSGASSTNSTNVTLTLSATDNAGVTGYCAKESSATPSVNDTCWTSITSTTSYSAGVTFILSTGDGAKTVYSWFKDAAGNITGVVSDSVTLAASPPAAPTGVTALPFDGQATISWNAVSGATSYNIYWSTTSGVTKTTGTKISGITSTSYIHTGLTNATAYYYVVIAVNDNGESGESAEIMVTPQALVPLPETGQTTCYDSSGNVIACAGTGQDGELQKGVAWPNPRFTGNGDGTVTENLTGLVWTKDGNAPGPAACSPATTKRWQEALDYVACLNSNSYLGYTDWRLPNINELKSLVHAGQTDTAAWLNSQGFTNVQSYFYWSSSSYANLPNFAWIVYMWFGSMGYYNKSNYDGYVWPVRSGQSGILGDSTISIPRTGQTICYDSSGNVIACAGTGQDGELQKGVAWPNPRFTGNGDGTVTENLTGLVWTKDGNAPGPAACSPATTKRWQEALDYVACLNSNSYLGYTDWRLPNINELKSLVHAGQSNTGTWLNAQGFTNVQSDYYWSSTSYAFYPDFAWIVSMWYGYMYNGNKSFNGYYVWPVRSGQ